MTYHQISINFASQIHQKTSKPILQVTHALSSIVAALTAATMGTPADVIKTRIMNQPLDSNGKGKTRSNYYQGFGIY